MNFRKFLAVGMVMVFGVVGVALAQPPVTTDMAEGDGIINKDVVVPINFAVESRAVMHFIPSAVDGYVDGLTEIGLLSDFVETREGLGNVGFILVQTNLSAWDVLVKSKTGGFLVAPDETVMTDDGGAALFIDGVRGPDVPNVRACQTFTEPMSDPCWGEPLTLPGEMLSGIRGRVLMKDNGGTLSRAGLDVGVGVVRFVPGTVPAGAVPMARLMALFGHPMIAQPTSFARDPDHTEVFTTLNFVTGGDFPQGIASLAVDLGAKYDVIRTEWTDLIGLSTATSFVPAWTGSGIGMSYYGLNALPELTADAAGNTAFTGIPGLGAALTIPVSGLISGITGLGTPSVVATAPLVAARGFPQMTSGYRLLLDQHYPGQPYYQRAPEAGREDQTMVFSISAKLNLGTGESLAGNKGGIYNEDLTFTFVASY